MSEQPRDPLGRFTSLGLDELQLQALDNEFGRTLRAAASAPKLHLGAPWARAALSASRPRPEALTDFGGGSRLQARPPRRDMDAVLRKAARDAGQHGRVELPVERP